MQNNNNRIIKITENALQNIDDITGYIAYIKHQPLNAVRVGDKIFETIDILVPRVYISRFTNETFNRYLSDIFPNFVV